MLEIILRPRTEKKLNVTINCGNNSLLEHCIVIFLGYELLTSLLFYVTLMAM